VPTPLRRAGARAAIALAADRVAVGLGLLATLALTAVLVAALLPLRGHLDAATPALVLAIPVVVGVAVGGFPVGVVGVGVGFLTYDALFIPPYGTLDVSAAQDWVALGVYAVVMLVVSRVVAALRRARAESRAGEADTRRLFEVSDLLIGDRPLADLLRQVAETVCSGFGLAGAALLLPRDDRLAVAAQAGEPLPEGALGGRLAPDATGTPIARMGQAGVRALPLVTAAQPVGLLVIQGRALAAHDQRLLAIYANHAALAVERGRLREEALQSRVLAEVDGWRRALLGSVAHDLRTPLASIKAAVSDLGDPTLPLTAAERQELLATVEGETDRLTRLLTSLLDVHRIEAGTLRVDRRCEPLLDIALEALDMLRGRLADHAVTVDIPPDVAVEVDHTLTVQALANLLDNAARHTPKGTTVVLSARAGRPFVELALADQGPGVEPDRLRRYFDGPRSAPDRSGSAIGAGVGLTIARTFVEVQGGRIAAGRGPAGGLRLRLQLPAPPGPSPG